LKGEESLLIPFAQNARILALSDSAWLPAKFENFLPVLQAESWEGETIPWVFVMETLLQSFVLNLRWSL
jgi:hypothetical protein